MNWRLDDPVKDKVCSNHLKLIKGLNPNDDSIISLNYDLIVDNVLNHYIKQTEKPEFINFKFNSATLYLQRTPGKKLKPVTMKDKEKGRYIKLHGSLNWIYCPSSDCINNRYFWPEDHSGEPCYACGTNIVSAIIPPTMKKSFEKFPKLGFIWHVAFNKLKEADRIIVIGMSFPDSDYYLKWLVRQAMMKRDKPPELVIVNPDIENDEFINKYKDIFGVSPAETYNGIDAYLV